MKKTSITAKDLATAGLIAALYVLLTYLANLLGLASGAIQIRISEALTILPIFTGAAVPGLFIGCLLANLLTGCAFWDIVFGSLATLIGAIGTYYIGRKVPVLGPVFPILANCIIVPPVLMYVYGVTDAYWYLVLTVGIGEVICCGLFGWILYQALKKRKIF
ncbi:MAG: QueT transporter family protein [Firmicutes bacterium]|jgi:uncharacterized membrane protein|nr:QueT transporter family protein [Bacillota bacterium]